MEIQVVTSPEFAARAGLYAEPSTCSCPLRCSEQRSASEHIGHSWQPCTCDRGAVYLNKRHPTPAVIRALPTCGCICVFDNNECVPPVQLWIKGSKLVHLGQMFEAYCDQLGADLGAVRFLYRVRRPSPLCAVRARVRGVDALLARITALFLLSPALRALRLFSSLQGARIFGYDTCALPPHCRSIFALPVLSVRQERVFSMLYHM